MEPFASSLVADSKRRRMLRFRRQWHVRKLLQLSNSSRIIIRITCKACTNEWRGLDSGFLFVFKSDLVFASFRKMTCVWLEIFFENYRRREFQRKVQEAQLPVEEQDEMMRNLARRETEYMRLQRRKIGIDDFELLTVIGKGAFGEVQYHILFPKSSLFIQRSMRFSRNWLLKESITLQDIL